MMRNLCSDTIRTTLILYQLYINPDIARTWILLLYCCCAAVLLRLYMSGGRGLPGCGSGLPRRTTVRGTTTVSVLAYHCDVLLDLFLANSYIACLLCYPG